jgi:hypothetical protein
MRQPSVFPAFFWTSLILILLGFGGLVLVIMGTEPTPGPRWLFFFLLTLAVTGLALPVTYFLNRRFPVEPQVEPAVVVREALWFGLYVDVLAWLQIGRVLTTGMVLALAAGLMLVEFLLRLGERSAWSPATAGNSGAAVSGAAVSTVLGDEDTPEGDGVEYDEEDEDEDE